VLREVFNIDAEICRDPRTNKPMCLTYNLLKGEETIDEEINAVPSGYRHFA
ncbi:MAG TPA: iron-enterobactin transporter ATP-binding protein, partial [Bacillales bacterium]|nr:iron-enterobactin transporter ATP-binding protein [Bacillales bacterium]